MLNACLSPVYVGANFWNICGWAASHSLPSHPFISSVLLFLSPISRLFLYSQSSFGHSSRSGGTLQLSGGSGWSLAARRHLILGMKNASDESNFTAYSRNIYHHLLYSIAYLYINLDIIIAVAFASAPKPQTFRWRKFEQRGHISMVCSAHIQFSP